MTAFQYTVIGFLTLLLIWELATAARHVRQRRFLLIRCATWFAAAVAIAFPHWVTGVGLLLGIRRGADFVLYGMVLTFIGTSFFFYSRYTKLEAQITELVRHQSIKEARQGGTTKASGTGESENES